ncbi:MAG: hypothetical protein ACTHLD_15775 [Chitinophaga sp.]
MTTENTNQDQQQDGSTPGRTRITQTRYDYYTLLQDVELRGKAIYGPRFSLHEEDRSVVLKLLCYFLQDEAIAQVEGIDLHKGIMLRGRVGCGKTSLMNIMRAYCPESFQHTMMPCRTVCHTFTKKGPDVIDHFGRLSFVPYTSVPRIFCFDDLGLESPAGYYGVTYNVMAEVLLSRYDFFVSHKMLTHVTTNLNSEELEGIYGNRVRSRMREMFNLISFNIDSNDKRK